MDKAPLVSIVMPVRNEGGHLATALNAIDAQTFPASRLEILVIDGGSTDGTLEVVRERMRSDDRVRLLGGPNVNTPLAMQLGIRAAKGEFIAKVDGHGWINERFIEVALGIMDDEPKVGCVGGIIEPIAATVVERAIAAARFSRLGVGGGVYTLAEVAQDTDTVQCGVYRLTALNEVGGFDPGLPFGEDEELNYRLRQRGWRIRLEPEMRFRYQVRPAVSSLFRQYFRYGAARVAVVRKHPGFLRAKHAAPAILVVTLAGGALLAVTPQWRVVGIAPWAGYTALISIGTGYIAAANRFARVDLIASSLVALHIGYGLGTLAGIARLFRRGGPTVAAAGM